MKRVGITAPNGLWSSDALSKKKHRKNVTCIINKPNEDDIRTTGSH